VLIITLKKKIIHGELKRGILINKRTKQKTRKKIDGTKHLLSRVLISQNRMLSMCIMSFNLYIN